MRHKDYLNCKNTNFTGAIVSSFKNLYFLISDHLYLCDFAKRCPLSFRLNMGIACVEARVAGKRAAGCSLARCQQRAQAQTYLWVSG